MGILSTAEWNYFDDLQVRNLVSFLYASKPEGPADELQIG